MIEPLGSALSTAGRFAARVASRAAEAVETKVESGAYNNASPWAHVALVAVFVAGYVLVGYFDLPTRIETAITAIAGWTVGSHRSRTYRPKNKGE